MWPYSPKLLLEISNLKQLWHQSIKLSDFMPSSSASRGGSWKAAELETSSSLFSQEKGCLIALPFLCDPNALLQESAFSDLWLTGLPRVRAGLTACLTDENWSLLEFIPWSLSSDSSFLACTRFVSQRSYLCHLFSPLALQALAPCLNLFVCQVLLDK